MASNKELQDQLDDQADTISQACGILEDAYTPEATRADLVAAVSQAIDVLAGEDGDGDDQDEDDEGE